MEITYTKAENEGRQAQACAALGKRRKMGMLRGPVKEMRILYGAFCFLCGVGKEEAEGEKRGIP